MISRDRAYGEYSMLDLENISKLSLYFSKALEFLENPCKLNAIFFLWRAASVDTIDLIIFACPSIMSTRKMASAVISLFHLATIGGCLM
jgi:hypothetical protein